FDRVFPAFLNDLAERGLLETTLVVAVGEFGRTPKLGQFTQSANTKPGGRDHWPHAFTALLAGGGVRRGQADRFSTHTAEGVGAPPDHAPRPRHPPPPDVLRPPAARHPCRPHCHQPAAPGHRSRTGIRRWLPADEAAAV